MLSILSICFGLFVFVIYDDRLPVFQDPMVGFEARDTELANRMNTWKLLTESTSWNGGLSLHPKIHKEQSDSKTITNETIKTDQSKKRNHRKNPRHRNKQKSNNRTELNKNPFESKNHNLDTFFCGKIVEDYVHFIVETNDGENLLKLNSIKNICKLDRYHLRMEQFQCKNNESMKSNQTLFCDYCEVKNFDDCCPSWTISNYILLHANKTDCEQIDDNDIDRFVQLLFSCSGFYVGHYLNEDCLKPFQCENVPKNCYEHENLVFNVLHYLVDYRFLDMKHRMFPEFNQTIIDGQINVSSTWLNNNRPLLRSTSIFLPMAKSSQLMTYFETISNARSPLKNDILMYRKQYLTHGNIQVVAADLGLKYTLFNKLVISDLILPLAAGIIILISLIAFTRSPLLTVMTFLTNLASLCSAYFIYTYLLQINFFPFLNLLSLIILVAIGSDNALIYCKAWSCALSYERSTLNRRQYDKQLSNTFNHVFLSSFCASFTTCGAFFAGYFSDITSLKCFSIFSGLSMITNFFITIIVFPSAIMISDYISKVTFIHKQCKPKTTNSTLRNDCFQYLFDKIILKIVFNYHHFWIALFISISLGSFYIVLIKPGLQLPVNQDFQIFNSDHLFERYDLQYRNQFWFSRIDKFKDEDDFAIDSSVDRQSDLNQLSHSSFVLPIRIIFGILPEDNGNFLDPFDRGKLRFDPDFDISSKRSQVWLLEFCRDIRAQTFYKPTLGPLLTNCFIETLQSWMERRKCTEIVGNNVFDHYPCCEMSKFPYEPSTFNQCLIELIDRLHHTPNFVFNANQAGPRFNRTDGSCKTFVIEYDSVYDALGNSFENIDQIWHKLNHWVINRLETAPKELKNGWFVTSNLEFYALQRSLSTGVIKSLFIAVLFAFITLIFTTIHLRLSIISIITITFVIFSSIATLVLLDWKLNIIESMVISLTIGLSIDATLHYTIAYKMLIQLMDNRLLGVQMTVARIGSPVAMGTITTFIAGAIMLFSNVLAYVQIGTFLMVISFFSLSYSTLFHLSLLIVFGHSTNEHGNKMINLIKHIYYCCCATFADGDKNGLKIRPTNNKCPLNNNNNKHQTNQNDNEDNDNDNLVHRSLEHQQQPNSMTIRSSTNSVCFHVTSI